MVSRYPVPRSSFFYPLTLRFAVLPASSSIPVGRFSVLQRASRLQETSRLLVIHSAALRETAQLLRSESMDLWSHSARGPVLVSHTQIGR